MSNTYQLNKHNDVYLKEDIINACRQVHGDEYDYSLLPQELKSKSSKIPIICHKKNILGEEHGVFEQPLIRHLSGRNCPKCLKKATPRSDEEIIALAKACHDKHYSYFGVIREKGKPPMIHGYCHHVDENGKEHGEFIQSVSHHVNGKQDCPKCRYVKSAASRRRSLEEVIKLAQQVHGDEYDYSFIKEYKNDRIKYPILCKKHNQIFYQSMNNHIQFKEGCPICGREKSDDSRRYTKEEWIEKAIFIHGDLYDYSDVDYKGSNEKIKIFCKKCKQHFWQLPTNHLFGQGCPSCKNSKLELQIANFLTEKGIKFTQQQTFDWLTYKRNMFLDFYLPEFNIAIECQGKQHFRCGGWVSSEEEFEEIEARDKIKQQLCKEHNIDILYFSNLGIEYPYKVIENEDLLLEEIKKYG